MSRQQVQKESNQPGVSLPGEKQDPLLKEDLPGADTNRKKMELDEKNKEKKIIPGLKDEGQTDDEPVEEKSDKL